MINMDKIANSFCNSYKKQNTIAKKTKAKTKNKLNMSPKLLKFENYIRYWVIINKNPIEDIYKKLDSSLIEEYSMVKFNGLFYKTNLWKSSIYDSYIKNDKKCSKCGTDLSDHKYYTHDNGVLSNDEYIPMNTFCYKCEHNILNTSIIENKH